MKSFILILIFPPLANGIQFIVIIKNTNVNENSPIKDRIIKIGVKGGYPIIFASNVFHNSHLIQKCIQNQQQLLILYTLLNQMRVVKNIRRKDDRITSL